MKHKISILLLICLQTGCAVELRDRNQQDEKPVTELRVDNEYALPIPLIQSEQIIVRYDRLVIGPNAQFITQGLNVRIEVNELISEGGTIRTFKSDQIALPGANGRSGGNLELVIAKASGNLKIAMQGEQGGKGLDGRIPDESLRGPKGAQGRGALYERRPNSLDSYLVARAENGQAGGQGLPGFPGGDGFKGGDSGKVSIRVADSEDFEISFQKNPGKGGVGGRGGDGGPGGFGGEPGIETPTYYNGPPVHNYAVAGPPGPQGPQGASGQVGINGYEEKICIQKGSEDLRCDMK